MSRIPIPRGAAPRCERAPAPRRARPPCRPCFRPGVENLENRWAPGSILLGETFGAPWLASVFGEGAAAADASPAHVSFVEPASVAGKSPLASAAASVPLAAHHDQDPALRPASGTAVGHGSTDSDIVAQLARISPAGPASGGDPLPIPGGFANPTGGPFIHFNLPGPADAPPPNPPTSPIPATNEPSTITDLNGDIAVANVTGTGTDGAGTTYTFEVDLRFMQGLYQDVNGNQQQGTFAFV